MSTFWYICDDVAETMDAIATPITDPANPIFADNRNDVMAASAPAPIWEKEMPLKKFFTNPTIIDPDEQVLRVR